MFGSHYVLSPTRRALWALRTAIALADDRGGALADAARALRGAEAAPLAEVIASPFITIWTAALGNLRRYRVDPPDWLLSAGLHGACAALGLAVASPQLPSPSGALLRPDEGGRWSLATDGPEGTTLVADSELLWILVGDHPSPIARDVEPFRAPLAAGLRFLAEVSPAQRERVAAHVRMIASFDEPPGLLQSLSVGELPGFVLLRARNGPAQVADQLVHEATHQLLDRHLAAEPALLDELQSAPAAYSPFFEQPRPAVKLLHGVVSYLEVLRLWRAILAREAFGPALSADAARARARDVEALCATGLRALRAIATRSMWRGWSRHLDALCPAFASLAPAESPSPPAVDDVRARLDALPWPTPTERAELLLASTGHKVSRLSLSIAEAAELARRLDPALAPLFSRRLFVTRAEQGKGTFHNVAESAGFEYYQPPPGATVRAYVGADPEALALAARADEEDAAGDALDIPDCCQAHFAAHWDDARARVDGDLLAWTLAHPGADDGGLLPWQCNAFAMVLEAGLTWHFPCSFRCAATVERISRRAQALAALDPRLAAALVAAQRRAVVWTSADRAFVSATLAPAPDGALVVIFDDGARSPEWTAGLRALAARGPLVGRDGRWRDRDGAALPDGVRVLAFG
jgi:hypothetical protein